MSMSREFKPKVYPRKRDAERQSSVVQEEQTALDQPVKKLATRKQLRQQEAVKKERKAIEENEAKNKLRRQQGKDEKENPGSANIPSFWEKIAEEKMYKMFRETGSSDRTIDKFQKKRVMMSLLIASLAIPAGLFLHVWLYLAGPILGFAFYKLKLKTYENQYKAWKFDRAMNFSKFTRLVIPYLKAAGGTTALFTIFNKILRRTEKDADKRSLYQLMSEMGDDPSNIQPFIDYAERSSGSDMSYLFMSTIFDYQQSTSDIQVIDELGQMAGRDMMDAIDEIIAMKLKRFVMFPTKVVMSSFILVAGLGGGLMLDNFKDLDLGGATAPMEAADNGGEVPTEDLSVEDGSEGGATAPVDDAADAAAPEEVVAPENAIDWEAEIETIANNSDLTQEAKAIDANDLANRYDVSDAEAKVFTERIQKEYASGLYKEALTNDAYILSNIFTSKVMVEKLKVAPSEPAYVLALGMWENSHYMYADGIAPGNPAIIENEKKMDPALAALE